jgi:hypothetical protein
MRWYRLLTLGLILLAWHPPARADANTVAAQAEMQSLADAESMCAVDTTYYVSLETLNDVSGPSTQTPYNSLNNEGGTWVIRPARGLFQVNRVNLLTAFNPWQGPYVNYQQGKTQTGLSPYDQGSPLDPWGTPYYFFTPMGLVRGDEGVISLEFYGDFFDRYTLVSLGLDGVQSTDDLIYQFGGGITTFGISSVRLKGQAVGAGSKHATRVGTVAKALPAGAPLSGGTFQVPAGSQIVVRGLNFGATQGTAEVLWGSTPLTQITAWSDREVGLTLPAGLIGTAALTLVRDGNPSLPATLVITKIVNATRYWTLYQ